jgi:DNA-directed RNA polymerase specialized sigma54-like protein
MDKKAHRPHLAIRPRVELRTRATLLARLQTVQLLQMSEREIAELVREAETDPIFEKLISPQDARWKIIRFQPNPRTRLSPSFYEMNEETLSEGARPEAARVIGESREALAVIQRIGQEKFESYFLRVDQELDRAGVARLLDLSEDQVQKVRDFLLTYSIQSEFFDPSVKTSSVPGKQVVRLARLSLDGQGDPVFEFGSPLLARGRYDIQYERLQGLLREESLVPQERRHLKAFVRRLELINWRHNTLYRLLDFVCNAQRFYLASQDTSRKVPITQRQLAKRLAVAPSTVNRAIQGRSLVLPWGEEVLLEEMFCSRKNLCLDVLENIEGEDRDFGQRTDTQLQDALRARVGFSVPRRTVNSYRRSMTLPSSRLPPNRSDPAASAGAV